MLEIVSSLKFSQVLSAATTENLLTVEPDGTVSYKDGAATYLKHITLGLPSVLYASSSLNLTPAASAQSLNLAVQTAATVFAAPAVVNGTPSFRALQAIDIPGLDAAKIITGTFSDAFISSAAVWNAKQDALVSGTNIKTIGSTSLLGAGDIPLSALNYWTLSGADVYRSSGKVFINRSSDAGAYNLQVEGDTWLNGNLGIGGGIQSGFKLDVNGQSVLRGIVYVSSSITNFSTANFNIYASSGYKIILNNDTDIIGFIGGTSTKVLAAGNTFAGQTFNLTGNAAGWSVVNRNVWNINEDGFSVNGFVVADNRVVLNRTSATGGAGQWGVYNGQITNNNTAQQNAAIYQATIGGSGTGGFGYVSLYSGFSGPLGNSFSIGTFTGLNLVQPASNITTFYGVYVGAWTASSAATAYYANIGAATNAWNFYLAGSANNYMAGGLGIGNSSLTGFNLRIGRALGGAATVYGIYNAGDIQPDATSARYYSSFASTSQASPFTVAHIWHFLAEANTTFGTTTVTNQYGFLAQSTLIGATNNYGFFGNIPTGTNRWNLYMQGTAWNYTAGALGIGSTSLTGFNLRVNKNITGATTAYGITSEGAIQSDVTFQARYFTSTAATAASVTISDIIHYRADQGTFGAGSVITNQFGYLVAASLVGATNNYAFYGLIPAGSSRWNLYMQGTANNYMAGSLGIGSISLTAINLRVEKNITGNITSYGIYNSGVIQSDVTANARYFLSYAQTQATVFTVGNLNHFTASQATFGAGSVVTNQYAFVADSTLIGAANNFGFYGNIAESTNNWNIYMVGTAKNYLRGKLIVGTLSTEQPYQLYVQTGADTNDAGYFRGKLGQSFVKSQILYADANGVLTAATGANIATILGTSASAAYILNQNALAQTANYWISGNGVIGGTLNLGNVASPNTKLEVSGGANFRYPLTDNSALYVRMGTYIANGLYGTFLKSDSYYSSTATTNLHLGITDGSASDRILITLKGSNSFVGVGTTDPLERLHVYGNAFFGTSTIGSPYSFQILINGSSPIVNRLAFGTDGTGWGMAISKNQGGTISDLITISDNGRVTIGTTVNGSKILQVNGGIRQNDVISGLVYANSIGEFRNAVIGDITSYLGDFYIKNQVSAPQTANAFINGYYRTNATTAIYLENTGSQDIYSGGGTGTVRFIDSTYAYANLQIEQGGGVNIRTNLGIGTANDSNKVIHAYSNSKIIGIEGQVDGSGTLYAIRGISTGVVTNHGGFFYAINGTSNFGVRIYGTPIGSDNYAIYSDAPAKSYFVGAIGIGTSTPVGYFEIFSTNASIPSIRLNSNFVGGNVVDFNPYITGISNNGFSIVLAGTNRFSITGGGKVLIGTTAENTYKVYINSGSTTGDGLYVNGKIFATDDIQSYSDKRLKENFKDIVIGNTLKDFKIQQYNKIGSSRLQIGVVAQELAKVFPQLVSKEGAYFGVSYSGIATLALGLGIENKNEIEELKEKVLSLQKEIEELKSK